MGRVAALLADYAILTTDNPRTEDPDRIARDVLAGMPADAGRGEYVADRAAAIARAIELAKPGDAVVIAGKGHEEYQIIGTERRPFSDQDVARAALQARYGP
jgi:UDP-N-acetylmuramoyl-L-alanyl-D-glutamate--2,6-diaminopimelate ligase